EMERRRTTGDMDLRHEQRKRTPRSSVPEACRVDGTSRRRLLRPQRACPRSLRGLGHDRRRLQPARPSLPRLGARRDLSRNRMSSSPRRRGQAAQGAAWAVRCAERIPMTRQTTIPNTDPIEPHPEIRTKLHAWLDAVAAAAEARDAVKRSHDTLLDAITEAKIPYYTYDADGKRKRVYPTVADPKLKTQNVASLEPKGRRGRARDVALPIDKEREKAVDALGTPGDR